MKKRHFLKTSAAFFGTVALTGCSSSQTSMQTTASIIPDADASQYAVIKSPEEWKAILTQDEFSVLREHVTEPPFSSLLNKLSKSGTYTCAGCSQPLYSSETKFDSGTGWPSFYQALPDAVGTSVDNTLFMTRTEVHCDRCGGHLGHIFDDGPAPTGKRHCINGVALNFVEA